MKRRKKDYIPLSDADRLHLVPDKALMEELVRRFSGNGRTVTMFSRVEREGGSDTYFLEDADTHLSRLARMWWQMFDTKIENVGDSVHIFEDGKWIDFTAGEDLDKESPNDKHE